MVLSWSSSFPGWVPVVQQLSWLGFSGLAAACDSCQGCIILINSDYLLMAQKKNRSQGFCHIICKLPSFHFLSLFDCHVIEGSGVCASIIESNVVELILHMYIDSLGRSDYIQT